MINEAIRDVDPSIRVISEPGRYYVTSAFTSAAYLHGKKTVVEGNTKSYMYYLNDGVYGSFFDYMLGVKSSLPGLLNQVRYNLIYGFEIFQLVGSNLKKKKIRTVARLICYTGLYYNYLRSFSENEIIIANL